MCMNARLLAELNKKVGNLDKWEKNDLYFKLAKKVLLYVHWNEENGVWYDYDLDRKEHIKSYYISNAVPLYSRCFDNENVVAMRVYKYMENLSSFASAKSIATSSSIEGLQLTGNPDLEKIAERYAVNWNLLTYQSYMQSRFMFEKYNTSMKSDMPYGGGGEYEVQTGFGWTNGVTMTFLLKYASAFERELKSAASQTPIFQPSYLLLYVFIAANYMVQ
ncbi:Trehalase [Trichuris trichiura]|uniref:Trehalase n=1 Tax=Trichuris trichiura TaxID=36087 RepID=A0A077ZL92_TRITR|nr:Trehalase [Trichuris trichiura]